MIARRRVVGRDHPRVSLGPGRWVCFRRLPPDDGDRTTALPRLYPVCLNRLATDRGRSHPLFTARSGAVLPLAAWPRPTQGLRRLTWPLRYDTVHVRCSTPALGLVLSPLRIAPRAGIVHARHVGGVAEGMPSTPAGASSLPWAQAGRLGNEDEQIAVILAERQGSN